MQGARQLPGVWRSVVAVIALAMLLAGCFQPAGSGLEPTIVDLAALTALAPTATPTVYIPPTNTPIPPDAFNQASLTPSPLPPTDVPTQPPVQPTDVPTTAPILPSATPPEAPLSVTETPALTPTPTLFLLPTPTPLPTENPCIHVVQPGEWLLKIARQYGIDSQVLLSANPWLSGNPNALQPGDRLTIPNCQATPPPAVPTTASGSEAAAPPVNPTPPTPIPLTDRIYIVVEGDTLGAIARKFGVTVQMLKDANGLTNDFLRVGQQLKIPAVQ